MSTEAPAFTCPAGHPRLSNFRAREGCAACREFESTAELIGLLSAAAPNLDAKSISDALEASGLKAATAFCDYLTERRRTLSTCRQVDLDEWAASRPRSATHALAGFARWAMARGSMPRLAIPTGQNHPPNAPLPDEARWALARHLLHGAGVDCGLRLAGALVVIYAQPLNKISRLRTVDLDVSADRVIVCLGTATIELPEPLAGHARQLIDERQPHPRKARLPVDAGWLFPGAPGRPINPDSLSDRLARLGIRAAQNRLAALLQLAADIPAPLLADLLGIHPNTAQVWSRLANRGWGDYQAMRTKADAT